VGTSDIFPTFQTWVLITLICSWSHCTVQNKLCPYRVVHCRYQRGTVNWWHLSASRDLRWG
jgi:hypothetical protein